MWRPYNNTAFDVAQERNIDELEDKVENLQQRVAVLETSMSFISKPYRSGVKVGTQLKEVLMDSFQEGSLDCDQDTCTLTIKFDRK